MLLCVSLVVSLLVGACERAATLPLAAKPDPTATTASPSITPHPRMEESLEGTEWLLTWLQGQPVLPGTRITSSFQDGQARGFAGCNSYGGRYEATQEGTLSIPEMAITAMACLSPEGVMDQEQVYVRALGSAATYLVANGHLEIENAAGETVLVFARREVYEGDPAGLVGTAWRLVSMDGRELVAGSTLTLFFHDDALVSGHAGCRDYLAAYQAEGGDLGFSYTAMMGPDCVEDSLLEQDGAYTTVLGWTAHYRLSPGRLELSTVRGETLAFEPLPGELQSTLEGPTWGLLAFVEPNPQGQEPNLFPLPDDALSGAAITAVFAGGRARGSAGCNNYDSAYSREGYALTVGPVAVTERACLEPAGIMELEGRFLDLLAKVTAQRVYGQQLWLETDDGRALVFRVASPVVGIAPSTEPVPAVAGLSSCGR
jgi:heat shock protein HslJ